MEYLDLLFCGSFIVGFHLLRGNAARKADKVEREYNLVKTAQNYTPHQLANELTNPKDRYLYSRFATQKDNMNELRGKVLLRGIIASDKPLTSKVDPNVKLIYSVTPKDPKIKVDTSSNRKPPDLAQSKVLFVKQFDLSDHIERKYSCQIQCDPKVDFTNILGRIDNAPKYKEGEGQVEWGIRVGMPMVVFGEVIFERRSKKLEVRVPEFFALSKSAILSKIQAKLTPLQLKEYIFLILELGALGYMCYRLYKLYKKSKKGEEQKMIQF
eukprot:TRINITY_DN9893_c0_g1_i2.p1 TRINITY_DN9893_c0_g1~~TRINITY_DN9893_c0_g1_i2.p1  ORF type:complete len:269 (+),score=60.24 TRINITY_DN9893_c0_g1_i2:113-919(+)